MSLIRVAAPLRVAGLLLPLLCASVSDASRVYRVRAGDSLYSLAQTAQTSVGALQRLNGLNGSVLRVGQAILLPGGTPLAAMKARASLPPAAVTIPAVFQSGMAVYYGGRRDARTILTAAHLTLPFGTWVEVQHTRTGRSVLVLINDRGPFGRPERVIDLSSAAARTLGIVGEGVAPVTLRIARQP